MEQRQLAIDVFDAMLSSIAWHALSLRVCIICVSARQNVMLIAKSELAESQVTKKDFVPVSDVCDCTRCKQGEELCLLGVCLH
jgi:hypothetical protein